MSRSTFCLKEDDVTGIKMIVHDNQCNSERKPNTEKRCHERKCQPEWHTDQWNEVRKTTFNYSQCALIEICTGFHVHVLNF